MNTPLPRITVITPSYNQAQFLERTIQSVLNQNYPNLQYAVIDGNSTDHSSEIIKKYADKLDFHIIESDRGQVDAINKGLTRATGDILCYINSDDTLLPSSLHTVGNHFLNNPSSNWVIGNCLEIDAHDNVIGRLDTTPVSSLAHALTRNERLEIPQPAIFWRKSLSDSLGLFSENYNFAFDYDLWCRFLAAGYKLEKINADLATYRYHEQSKTCSLSLGFLENHIRIESSHAHNLSLKDRIKFNRMFGYRLRQYAILNNKQSLFIQILKRPWWLASQQIREHLFSHAA